MARALVALPFGTPLSALQGVLALNPSIRPVLLVEGLGAVLDLPSALVQAISFLPGIASVSTGPLPAGLPIDPAFQPWLAAWNRFVSPQYQSLLNARTPRWLPQGLARAAVAGASPPHMTLTGTIALGVVIVSGPPGSSAQLTPTDYADIVLALIHGVDHLYASAPASARLVFVSEQRLVTLPVDPATVPGPVSNPTFQQQEDRERLWRDPALASLGLPSGFAGIEAYRAALRAKAWVGGAAANAVVGLISRYNLANSAYAASGRWVLSLPLIDAYPGRDHLDRVIAHETCHLFEALDEYQGCNPATVSGPFGTPNGNCIHGIVIPGSQAPCLMAGTSDDLCGWTKAQVGWLPFP